MANRDNHLKKVAERQKLAEEQIRRLEAELSEAKKRKEQEVRMQVYKMYTYMYILLATLA